MTSRRISNGVAPMDMFTLCDRFTQQPVILDADDIYWLTQGEVLLTATRLDTGQSMESLTVNTPQRKAEHQAAMQANPPMAMLHRDLVI
jgi:hypothetical protein